MPTDPLIREKIDTIAEDVREIRRLVTGGPEPSKGIIVRLDRLEQAETGRRWATRSACVAAIGFVGRMLWEFVKGK